MVSIVSELLQHTCVGGRTRRRLLEHRQLQPLEQNLAQLRVGVDVELFAGGLVDLLLHALSLALKTSLERREVSRVNQDARPLHLRENRGQWHFHVAEQRRELKRVELRLETVAQLPS